MKETSSLTDQEIECLLNSSGGRRLEDLVKSYKEKSLKMADRAFEDDFQQAKLHDVLVQACISAFLTDDGSSKTTSYNFVTVEPLCELNVRNFDLLILNESQGLGIFVECKSSLNRASTVVERVIEKIPVLEKNQSYLESQIGAKVNLKEYVLCVPSEFQVEVSAEVERRTSSSEPRIDDPFLIWGFHRFFDNPTLKLSTMLNTVKKEGPLYHRDPDLTRILSQGIIVNTEIVGAVFPSSHPLVQAMSIVAWLLAENQRLGWDLRRFKKKRVQEFFNDSRNLPHYAREVIGAELSQRFVREGIKRGLLIECADDPEALEFAVEGKTVNTIVKNYRNGFKSSCVEAHARRLANRQAWEDYHSRQQSLRDFIEPSNQNQKST